MLLSREFTFDSAHYLEDYHGKCENMHGHTYRLRVTVSGRVRNDGMVMDFAELKGVVRKFVIDELDHKLLNDIIKNPSAEKVVIWIWERLKNAHMDAKLHEITLYETAQNFVTYNGNDS